MSQSKILGTHRFTFNPEAPSGEHLDLLTEFHANGDPITDTEGIFRNHKLCLQAGSNRAVIELFGASITPAKLRELANQLDKFNLKVRFENKTT